MKITRTSLYVLLLCIASLGALVPLFYPGFFQSDDGGWMVIRSTAFHEAFRDGQIPTRFLGRLNNLYGYPVANFLYPLYLYIAEPFIILGLGFINTIKLIIGVALLSSSLFTFLWLRRVFDAPSAVLGAVVYLYLPYHLFTTYTRGSVGEVLALGIIPFIFYSLEKRKKILSGIGIALLILAHNTLAVLFLPILFIYMTLLTYDKSTEKSNFSAFRGTFELGLGLSAFFWLPALWDLQYTIFSTTQIANFRNYFADSSLIGYVSIAVLTVAFCVLWVKPIRLLFKEEIGEHRRNVFGFMLILGLLILFFSSELSRQIWEYLPSQFIQFPYRLLSVLIPVVAFLSAFVTYYAKKGVQIGAFVTIPVLLLFSVPFLQPSGYSSYPDEYYATNMDTTTVHHEYMPKWVETIPTTIPPSLIQASGEITDEKHTNTMISFSISTEQEEVVRVNKVYFPGWVARVNTREVPIRYDNSNGVMQISVPSGNHEVHLKFGETPLRLFADVISLFSLCILIFFAIRDRNKKVA